MHTHICSLKRTHLSLRHQRFCFKNATETKTKKGKGRFFRSTKCCPCIFINYDAAPGCSPQSEVDVFVVEGDMQMRGDSGVTSSVRHMAKGDVMWQLVTAMLLTCGTCAAAWSCWCLPSCLNRVVLLWLSSVFSGELRKKDLVNGLWRPSPTPPLLTARPSDLQGYSTNVQILSISHSVLNV